MSSGYIIGIDGGGTRSTAVLITAKQKVLVTQHGGPTNVNTVGVEQTAHTLSLLINDCCLSIRCTISDIDAIVVGLAGAGNTEVQERIKGILEGFFGEKLPIIIENDARVILESAFDDKGGLVCVVGTGSVLYGKRNDDFVFSIGGWGRLLGDEGSGWWLGREFLRVVLAELDGYGKHTQCTNILANIYNFSNHQQIIEAVYRKHFDVASLAPLLLKAAEKKDAVAASVVETGCNHILKLIRAGIKQLRWKEKGKIPLVLTGSLVTKNTLYKKILIKKLSKVLPDIQLRRFKHSPAEAAAKLGFRFIQQKHFSTT